MGHPEAGAALVGLGMIAFMVCLGIAIFVLWIMSIVDVIKNDFQNPNNKIIWILLLLFIAPLATILYQLVGRNQKVTM